jgi:hypothetical protein
MSDDPRFDRAAREWVDVGPALAPAGAVAAAMAKIASIERPRRRGWRPGVRPVWRGSLAGWLGAAAGLIAAVVVLSAQFGGIASPGGSSSPGSLPTAAPTPVPTAVDTTRWITFTSNLYGYSFRVPPTFQGSPSGDFWTLEKYRNQYDANHGDDILTDEGVRLFVWSIASEEGLDLPGYVDALIDAGGAVGAVCPQPREDWTEIAIDDTAGLMINNTCNSPWAMAVTEAGGRFYTFRVESIVDYPDNPVFRAIVASVDLRPEDAVDPPAPTGSAALPTSSSP